MAKVFDPNQDPSYASLNQWQTDMNGDLSDLNTQASADIGAITAAGGDPDAIQAGIKKRQAKLVKDTAAVQLKHGKIMAKHMEGVQSVGPGSAQPGGRPGGLAAPVVGGGTAPLTATGYGADPMFFGQAAAKWAPSGIVPNPVQAGGQPTRAWDARTGGRVPTHAGNPPQALGQLTGVSQGPGANAAQLARQKYLAGGGNAAFAPGNEGTGGIAPGMTGVGAGSGIGGTGTAKPTARDLAIGKSVAGGALLAGAPRPVAGMSGEASQHAEVAREAAAGADNMRRVQAQRDATVAASNFVQPRTNDRNYFDKLAERSFEAGNRANAIISRAARMPKVRTQSFEPQPAEDAA